VKIELIVGYTDGNGHLHKGANVIIDGDTHMAEEIKNQLMKLEDPEILKGTFMDFVIG